MDLGRQLLGSRPWKGGDSCGGRQQGKDCDPRFLIHEDAIMESNCSDSRTTVMIKNIPNKYSQNLFLNMLDNHCIHCNEQIGDDQPISAYDFAYLPIDFRTIWDMGSYDLLMQPLVAVPSFICADALNKFLPFATGFASGCMIWMVITEVLPEGFKAIFAFTLYNSTNPSDQLKLGANSPEEAAKWIQSF